MADDVAGSPAQCLRREKDGQRRRKKASRCHDAAGKWVMHLRPRPCRPPGNTAPLLGRRLPGPVTSWTQAKCLVSPVSCLLSVSLSSGPFFTVSRPLALRPRRTRMSQPSVPSDWPGTPPTDTPAPSTDASRTSGLASGLCIALAIIMGLTVYVLRRRIFPLGAHTAATPPRRSDTLAPEALALLPTHTHDDAALTETSSVSGAAPGPNDRCCSVCTEPFMHGAQLRKLPCGHQFDRACIDPWLLGRSATCPLW